MISLEQYRQTIGLGGFPPARGTAGRIVRIGFSSLPLLKSVLLSLSLLLFVAGDVEINPGPQGQYGTRTFTGQMYKQDRNYSRGSDRHRQTRLTFPNMGSEDSSFRNFSFRTPMDTNQHYELPRQDTNQQYGLPPPQAAGPPDIGLELQKLNQQMTSFRLEMTELKNEVSAWRDSMNGKIDHIEQNQAKMNSDFSRIQSKLVELDDRSRKNNLLLFGIGDAGSKESKEDTEAKVRDLFRDNLGLEQSDEIELASVGRVGRKFGSRPVLVSFANLVDRSAVMSAARDKLTADSQVRVKQDFSRETQLAQQKLSGYYNQAVSTRDRDRVKVVRDVLYVDKDAYKFDMETNRLYKIPSRVQQFKSTTNPEQKEGKA